jgi:hypothetical protein
MEYQSIDNMTEEEIAASFDIKMTTVFELEQELRDFSRREAEFMRKAVQANKKYNKLAVQVKITEAELVNEIRRQAIVAGKPIASSAIGELRKSMVAKEPEWQAMSIKLNKARYKSELWSGFLSAWQGRGFRLQELAKISERSLWGEKVTYSTEIPDFRGKAPSEQELEKKLEAQDKLEL